MKSIPYQKNKVNKKEQCRSFIRIVLFGVRYDELIDN